MKKLITLIALLAPALAAAQPAGPAGAKLSRAVYHVRRPHAALLTRAGADRYYDHATGATLVTSGCTQTATLMDGRLADDPMHRPGKRFVVFYDSAGHEEGDCEVVALLLPKSRPAPEAK